MKLAIIVLLALALSAPAHYMYEDRSTESGLAFGAGGHTCWLHCFDSGRCDIIKSVSVAWGVRGGIDPLNGMPCDIYVWEDPDDDCNPDDAFVLASVSAIVRDVNTDTFHKFTIPHVTVRGKFFVGCHMDLPPMVFPAGMDTDTPYNTNESWFAGNGTRWNPNDIGGNNGSIFEMASVGYPFHWMIRANM